MAYLIPILLVLLLVTGFVTFVVLRATSQSKPSEAQSDEDADPSTMAATDASPLGDTTEHAGEQSHGGETVEAPEGEGQGESESGSATGPGHGSEDRGGDLGEATADTPTSESERLADRHQV